jgi:hypothetical protein
VVALDAGARRQAQLVGRPETAVLEVGGGAAGAVAGHGGLRAVGVENAQAEVGPTAFAGRLDDGDAVGPRPVVAVADAAHEVAEGADLADPHEVARPAGRRRQLPRLEDDVVVPVAVKFGEAHSQLRSSKTKSSNRTQPRREVIHEATRTVTKEK